VPSGDATAPCDEYGPSGKVYHGEAKSRLVFA